MAIKLADIKRETRTLELEWQGEGGGDLTVVYYIGKLTPTLRISLLSGSEAYQSSKKSVVANIIRGWGEYCTDLAGLIQSWDLLGEDDLPIPLTAEALGTVPWALLTDIARALVRDSNLNPQKGVALPATSPPMDSQGK